MLSKEMKSFFDSGIRNRGENYFRSGRVTIRSVEKNKGLAVADVQGEELYEVLVAIDKDSWPWGLEVNCSCPYVADNDDFCKHIWAALLKIETMDPFASLPKNTRIRMMGDVDEEDIVPKSAPLKFPKTTDEDPATRRMIAELEKIGIRLFSRGGQPSFPSPAKIKPTPKPPWASLIGELSNNSYRQEVPTRRETQPLKPTFVLELEHVEERGCFSVGLFYQETRASGQLGKMKKLSISSADLPRITDPLDRQICLMLVGAGVAEYPQYGYYRNFRGDYRSPQSSWNIPEEARGALLPLLFQTGRFVTREREEFVPLTFDDAGPWELFLNFDSDAKDNRFHMSARLRRGEEQMPLSKLQYLIPGQPTLGIHDRRVSEIEVHGCLSWARAMRHRKPIEVKGTERDGLLRELTRVDQLPPIVWPKQWKINEVVGIVPTPELHLILTEDATFDANHYASAEVKFRYQDLTVDGETKGQIVLDPQTGSQLRRDLKQENARFDQLWSLGFDRDPYSRRLKVKERRLPAALTTLLEGGWTVLGNRKLFRTGGTFKTSVRTGIDWFELEGGMDFGGQSVALPVLLAAARKGERFVRLGDGSMGMLPEEWIQKHSALLNLGNVEDGQLRFAKSQIGIIDALLAAMPEAEFDKQLGTARAKLHSFAGIQPMEPPDDFVGTLRPYQKQGLAWLNFLNDFGWGGCLADDMGLGKTVQMLALFADRKCRGDRGPTLVIVPKSLIFNWVREASAFAPHLRVLDYTGTVRKNREEELAKADLVFTTYGTLKRDIESLAQREFNYVVLDEAQAIKNAESQNAKAVRLLKARHRIVMTGTPVENRLSDLWSLFEFLNPGMLGTVNAFRGAFGTGKNGSDDGHQFSFLQRVLRPFILRRTKEQVAPELPKRSEQTIECEMTPKQAAYYKELRDYYRDSLLGKVEREGIAKNKIVVLEALLRLRQAACHPGLIDESKRDIDSAKLEALVPMISELVEEGHKALIFSQFVKMLDIVRATLDKQGVTYEYLDGQTRDRQARVDRFQTDPKCPLFLISLKAGGVGLNLTAADYVFILDPWWNPAVEAQAIDRTHRIGQDKNIIAYRIVARDTVEQKILQLQQSKRDLADAIITQANSLIQGLTKEDLSLLLS